MRIWHAIRNGLSADRHGSLRNRMEAWHRDLTARAMAIARWEDDGGFVGDVRLQPRPIRVTSPTLPPRARDI